ncbi:MAG: AI-2E family transporter [Chloroflexota bacterium]|nr:AI-2E family transporter [Chloroflexota bacterium]
MNQSQRVPGAESGGESVVSEPPPGLSFPAWTMRQVIAATLTALGVALAFVLVYRFYMVVFIFFGAAALEVAMRPAVLWLEARGLRRWLGVLLVYALLLALIVLLIWLTAPLLVAQSGAIVERLPDDYQQLRNWLGESSSRLARSLGAALPVEIPLAEVISGPGAAPPPPAADAEANSAVEREAATEAASTWAILRLGAYGSFVTLVILALSFYWTLEREVITRRLEMRIPRQRREQARALILEVEGKIGGYFRGQIILCVIVGVVSVLAFWLIGVPYALVLGVLMGIFEAVPVIGPILGAAPAIVITLATAPDKVIWTVAALVAIQVLEGNLLVPRVMDQSVGVNAIVSILAITAFGALFGIAGAVLAIPLAAILQILINRALFNLPMPEDALSTTSGAGAGKRDRLALLRMETHELIQDVRKLVRSGGDDQADAAGEEAEDIIEDVAQALDAVLVQMEKPA